MLEAFNPVSLLSIHESIYVGISDQNVFNVVEGILSTLPLLSLRINSAVCVLSPERRRLSLTCCKISLRGILCQHAGGYTC